MKRVFLILTLVVLCCTSSLYAINNRSYLSVFAGSDANDCSTPALACVTYARAHTQTNPSGEIVVIGNGGYGSSFTITKSINVTVVPGVYAANRPVAGGAAITISAGASDIVRLSGMQIEGIGGANSIGILINSGAQVELENLTIKDAAIGIKINSPNTRVYIHNCHISGFFSSPVGTGVGIWQTTGASTAKTVVWGVRLNRGDIGFKVDDGHFYWSSNANGTEPSVWSFITTAYTIAATTKCVQTSVQTYYFVGAGTGSTSGGVDCGLP